MYNILGYIFFLIVLFYITVNVGWTFYKNGLVFVRMLLPGDEHLAEPINKILLVGYYLTNLGYVIFNMAFWEDIFSLERMLEVVFLKAGRIILLLAILHYLNLFWLLLFSRKQKNKLHLTKS